MKWLFILLVINNEIIYPAKNGSDQCLKSSSYIRIIDTVPKTFLQQNQQVKKNGIYVGGEYRFQYLYNKNEEWGDAPEDNDGYILSRLLINSEIKASDRFRVLLQLQSSLSGSRIDPSPVDDNPLDFHQAFIEYVPLKNDNNSLTIRAGRQEFMYGSQRLISIREGPNNRLAFDAVRMLLKHRKLSADIFYSHPVKANPKIFDDGFNSQAKLWGAYFVLNDKAILNADLYYLGLWKAAALFDDGLGKELRHTLGLRLWKTKGSWKYDFEAVYQNGRFADKKISAWTASINTSYVFAATNLRPELGIRAELISGDRFYNDQHLGTFNPLFPKGAYFGLAALIGPANLMDIHPLLSLSLSSKILLGLDCDFFWRYSRNDGLYAVSGALIYSGKDIYSKYIGSQPAINITYTADKRFSFRTEFTWFKAGRYLHESGSGKDIYFAAFTAGVKFGN
jgi:hypothetical protein